MSPREQSPCSVGPQSHRCKNVHWALLVSKHWPTNVSSHRKLDKKTGHSGPQSLPIPLKFKNHYRPKGFVWGQGCFCFYDKACLAEILTWTGVRPLRVNFCVTCCPLITALDYSVLPHTSTGCLVMCLINASLANSKQLLNPKPQLDPQGLENGLWVYICPQPPRNKSGPHT